ncbi:MAG: hypothetical protein KDB03_04900 [Planctomycetales bacterium]|nr:hypothetical protein [Planctomycetales bacterium]
MDPNQCWRDLLDAIIQLDWETAANLASNLRGWLARNGFPPNVINQLPSHLLDAEKNVRQLQTILALRTCEYVLSLAQQER